VLSRRAWIALAGTGVLAACGVPRPERPRGGGPSAPSRLAVRQGSRVRLVRIEDYVLGSALAEITPLDEAPATVERVYDVQAVLARSFAVANVGRHRAEGFDLCDTSHCQLYEPDRIRSSRFAAAAQAAVERTAGVVVSYADRPADALFHADCGGHTAAIESVWGGAPVPYLRGESDALPAAIHRVWTTVIARDDLHRILNEDPRARVGRFDGLRIRQRDASGRAAEVSLLGASPRAIRGEVLRAIVNRRLGERALQSTRFTVDVAPSGYTFRGSGFGHGVGLCQRGAMARARRGDSLPHILDAYYRGAGLGALRS
jgi:stage II sporulation protein D (peptidoglycan lytic transglycosylase)